jgi:hypothetical protein
MAKSKPGVKRTPATKRWRCLVCRTFGHNSEGCWLLEKSEDNQLVVFNTLPIADKMDNEGKEGLV